MGADTAYTFGHIDQNTVSLTARVDYTLTPRCRCRSTRSHSRAADATRLARATNDPRNYNYSLRFRPYGTQEGAADVQLRCGGVQLERRVALGVSRGLGDLRRVDAGAQFENDGSPFGNFNVHGSARDLYAIHPDNTFLIKASYWFSL